MTETEKWLPVAGFEGVYEISSLGRVISIGRRVRDRNNRSWHISERILSLGLTRKGYPCVNLNTNGCTYPREVHRMVCTAFHGPCPVGHEAAHTDGNRQNCREDNLLWKTRAANHADKRGHGTLLTGSKVPNAKLDDDSAIEVCRRALNGENMCAIARDFGVSEKTVRKIKSGEMWADHTLAVRAHLLDHPNAE